MHVVGMFTGRADSGSRVVQTDCESLQTGFAWVQIGCWEGVVRTGEKRRWEERWR